MIKLYDLNYNQNYLHFSFIRRSNRNFKTAPSPPGPTPGIRTFKDWIVQIPAPLGPKWCSNPSRICPSNALLKNNRRRFLSSVIKLVHIHGTRRHQFKMEIYFRHWLRVTRYALRTRNTYYLVSRLHRMWCEWQGSL